MVRGIPLTRRHLMLAMAGSGAMLLGKPRFALAQEGSILKVRSYSDIQIMDPAFRLSAPEGDIMRAIYTGLVTFKTNADWGWELDGAEMINQIDDTHIEFKLRPGIMFTNGFGEMTAEDVKYSYERFINPALEAPYKDDFAVLKEVQVTDKYSGVIVLNEPFAPMWTSTLPTESGNILSKAAVEAAGGKLGVEVPCSSGPYLLKEWQPKQKTILAKNPEWTGTPGDFDEIHIYPIEDEKTAELGFEAGDIDFTWVSVSSIKRLTDTPPAGGVVVQKPSLAYVWLGMNVENPAMQNPLVRRAIQHAIDVPTVLDAAYFGGAAPSTGIIAPGLAGNRAANLYGYDPEKSKALLAEAGLADGFECTLDCLNKTDRVNLATAIQAQLAEVGIKVNVQAHDSGVFWTLGDQSAGEGYKNLQLILSRFSMNPDPSWATAWFTPDQIGIWNWERWNSPEFGEMHKQGLIESDPAKRDELYKKMQDMMEESGAYVFLTHEAVGVLHRDTLAPGMLPNGTPVFPGMKKA